MLDCQVGVEEYEPEELRDLGPRDLSYWIASNFREMPQHQQILLQASGSERVQCWPQCLDLPTCVRVGLLLSLYQRLFMYQLQCIKRFMPASYVATL